MKKFSAFTLAEVLITLGIIGVVAAMTMPTLINQTNGAQYRAAFKKELSVISQAVTLNVALEDFDFSDLTGDDNSGVGTLSKLLQNRANVVRVAKTSDLSTEGYKPIFDSNRQQGDGDVEIKDVKDDDPTKMGSTAILFNDGSMFIFDDTVKGCSDTTNAETEKSNKCLGWFDVNGMKGPNKETKCDGNTTSSSSNNNDCSVKIPTDIFPVKFFDQTILPNSGAGRAVLYDNGNTATRADSGAGAD